MSNWISQKPIAHHERLIFALDVAGIESALALVQRLGDAVSFYKIGMELLTSGRYFELIETLAARGKKVFVDLKFFDVPATVASAVKGLRRYPVDFCTVHGNNAMLRAAAEVKGSLKILGVTALTSLDQDDLRELGFACAAEELVLSRARGVLAAGCDGVISSGLEVARLRAELDHRLLVICPGIRPVSNDDDQKRTVDVRQAFLNGADYIVVGRPIRNAPDPRAAALAMHADIEAVFAEGA
jgi:orotidine-5'-phosphate decarboxylase